eukprot:3254753-Prymnesium_polylepis.1
MPAYQAKDVSLCSLSAAIGSFGTALTNQGGSQHEDCATPVGAPHRPPNPSWGGYWGGTPACSAMAQTTEQRSPRRSRRAQSRALLGVLGVL